MAIEHEIMEAQAQTTDPVFQQQPQEQKEEAWGIKVDEKAKVANVPAVKDRAKYDVRKYLNVMQPHEYVSQQTVICDESEGIRCSPMVKDGNLLEFMYDDARTLHEGFLRGLRVSKNGNCLGYRSGQNQSYTWIKYQEVLDRAQNIGSGLIAKGAETKPTQFIGIFSQNRVEWSLMEQACNAYSMVIVPLYDTLGPQAMKHILKQCKISFLLVDRNVKALTVLKEEETFLKLIIMVEDANEETTALAKEKGVELLSFTDLEELGEKDRKEFVPPSPDDLHVICYTSGTTGNPKGVMLTHKNIIADFSGVRVVAIDSATKFQPSDVHLSYLPLAHIFEKCVQGSVYQDGGSIGYFGGDMKLLLADIAALRPTILPMVPRLMNRLYGKVTQLASSSFFKRKIFNHALKKKTADLKRGIVSRNTIWDKLVFGKVQRMLGGRLRLCVTGAAPISPTVLQFMRCALGIPFSEAYGQTEGIISLTVPGDYMGGNVGTVIPSCLVKLVDVPEKNYFAKDNKGEVCTKGPNVCQGYYNDPEKTKEAIDEDGWLHTGDVGQWLPNGSLKIFDRRKHIFKLSQGEYIAPEKIEQVYVQCTPVAQIFLHGESLKSTLVAVIVPDPEVFVGWCKERGVKGTYDELCESKEAEKIVLEDMNVVGKKMGLHSFEMAKKICLCNEQFSIDNQLLTPTFKNRRLQLLERFKSDIDRMYEGMD